MHSPVQNASEAAETQSLKSHSLAYLEDAESGIRVPVTEIALEPSPGGKANAPLQVYRTAGPGSDPVVGLPPFRGEWIADRSDTEAYGGRERNLLDDGKPHCAAERHRPNGREHGTSRGARNPENA